MSAVSALRAALLDMRFSLVVRLARRFDGGTLALLGTVGAALAAVDRVGAAEEAAPAARRVTVCDRPDRPLGLTVFDDVAEVAVEVVALDPRQAVALAGELLAAALPRLGGP